MLRVIGESVLRKGNGGDDANADARIASPDAARARLNAGAAPQSVRCFVITVSDTRTLEHSTILASRAAPKGCWR